MPGKDREYIYPTGGPDANKASRQSSANNRTDGLKDITETHGEIMQKENMKNKGTNQRKRDSKVGTEHGPKK
jgi:hypothetical protein